MNGIVATVIGALAAAPVGAAWAEVGKVPVPAIARRIRPYLRNRQL